MTLKFNFSWKLPSPDPFALKWISVWSPRYLVLMSLEAVDFSKWFCRKWQNTEHVLTAYTFQYCSRECQKAHWPIHKHDCKSPLMKSTWTPGWVREKRQPTFVTDGPPMSQYGRKKYLWGNVSAIDILNLGKNEVSVEQDFSILFAASGDLRNVVKSVNSMVFFLSARRDIVINDIDIDIVARNAILLLVAMNFPAEEAASMMLHLWYSALVPQGLVDRLQKKIMPLVQDVCTKIREKPSTSLQSKTWRCGPTSLRLVLQKQEWDKVLLYFQVPDTLSADQAQKIRVSTTLARMDHVDRALFSQQPGWRVGMMKFREDGILLPFGASRHSFKQPNPTFYHVTDDWPMMDSAEPLNGWAARDVRAKASVKNDLYGGLALHIVHNLTEFCHNIQLYPLRFQLFQVDARALPNMVRDIGLPDTRFDRIEVSNITDLCHLGPAATLSTFGPMLKRKAQNPHATLLTLFINAVHESITPLDEIGGLQADLKKVMRYIPFSPNMMRDKTSPQMIKVIEARMMFRDFDELFERYMKAHSLPQIGRAAGLEMKDRNTIVDPFPFRLSKNATQEEFDMKVCDGASGGERYVEWRNLE
ncbi:uncharacterized protein PAC_15632 [Phialocephala subalpina]|uniref:MYND-type domain-containing protein n=1 Tax=Phialocephala subalpina TaxID=576137 RepID=A0A1L7XL21_9HELO|nr:uncharacterized protein PAC_15632 [Phialocephala subalpina]